ncbi:MAG TPA: hypothetical protein VK510_03160 [Solirubrobacteraceae bacterium]|nr:hypothetical protein [Solirubrobacteraceae bacterium]
MQTPFRKKIGSYAVGAGGGGQWNMKREIQSAIPRELNINGKTYRPLIAAILLKFDANLTTDGTTSLTSADLATLMKEFYFADAGGERYRFDGFDARVFQYQELGIGTPVEPAALAISQTGQVRSYLHLIPFALPRALRPSDFAIPVDDACDGAADWRVDIATPTDVRKSGSNLTINSITVTAYVYLLPELGIECKARLMCLKYSDANQTDVRIPVNNKALRSLSVYQKAAGGGTAMSNFTSATFPAFQSVQLERAMLQQEYLSGMAYDGLVPRVADDPVSNNKVVPLFTPPIKAVHFPRIERELEANFVNSVGGQMDYLITEVDRQNGAIVANTIERYSLDPSLQKTAPVKTVGKSSNRTRAAWGKQASTMPLKLD